MPPTASTIQRSRTPRTQSCSGSATTRTGTATTILSTSRSKARSTKRPDMCVISPGSRQSWRRRSSTSWITRISTSTCPSCATLSRRLKTSSQRSGKFSSQRSSRARWPDSFSGRPKITMSNTQANKDANKEFEELVRRELELLGEDPARDGLLRTPARVARALKWMTQGYGSSAQEGVGHGIFKEEHDNMIMVRDIELYSMCEHHMLPFLGKAHVGYIPNGKIVGLSKIPRVVGVSAQRLQVQERLTVQIDEGL